MRSNNAASTCGCIVLLAVVVIAGLAIAGPKVGEIFANISGSTGEDAANESDAYLAGVDPHAFTTAIELYNYPKKQTLSDQTYITMLDRLDELIDTGAMPEDEAFETVLLMLDGAPDQSVVLAKLESAMSLFAAEYVHVSMPASEAQQQAFAKANKLYEDGDFSAASRAYRQILAQNPYFADARNNLGLSELHQGNNLAALMQFRLLQVHMPDYLAADQNISVVLERLGQSEAAYKHAGHVVEQNQALPMALYNLAWFENQRQDYKAAAGHFDDALELSETYSKAKQARALNKLESGEKLSKAEKKALPEAVSEEAAAEPDQGEVAEKAAGPVEDAAAAPAAAVPWKPTWWWWTGMAAAIVAHFGFFVRSAVNDRQGSFVWVFLTGIVLIIVFVVYSIWFRDRQTFGMVLLGLAALNSLIMIPASNP